MLTKEQILSILKVHKPFLETEMGVKKIGLFGSYAKSLQMNDGDVDIFVEIEKTDYKTVLNILLYLEEQLDAKVDLLYNGQHLRTSFLNTLERETIYA